MPKVGEGNGSFSLPAAGARRDQVHEGDISNQSIAGTGGISKSNLSPLSAKLTAGYIGFQKKNRQRIIIMQRDLKGNVFSVWWEGLLLY